jgi:hypothetical protein
VKQKYTLTINPETKKLAIREYAEIEKGEFAFVCEELHDIDAFKDGMAEGAAALVPIIRRPNMYPRQDFGERIAQGIIDLLNDDTGETKSEILINDVEAFESAEDDVDPRVVYEGDDEDDDSGDADELDLDDALNDDDSEDKDKDKEKEKDKDKDS